MRRRCWCCSAPISARPRASRTASPTTRGAGASPPRSGRSTSTPTRCPRQGAVVIVTASYNGQPPDNAAKFCQKLRDPALPSDAFAGVEYSVFGCGNRDWSATYQAIPTLIDAELEKHGAKRIYKRGEGDARGDFDRDYRAWYGELFPSLAKALDLPAATAEAKTAGPRISVSFVNRLATSPIMRSYSAVAMTVRMNRELQRRDCERPSERSTRHIEIALPSGVSYSAGDHLGIVPRNGLETIRRVLMRFKLDPSLYATIAPRANADTHLPVNEPVPLLGILANRIELQDVATREQIATLAAARQGREGTESAARRSPAMTRAMASRFSRRASRCSIFWTNIRPARRLSRSFSI